MEDLERHLLKLESQIVKAVVYENELVGEALVQIYEEELIKRYGVTDVPSEDA